jgi:hypothetical protein
MTGTLFPSRTRKRVPGCARFTHYVIRLHSICELALQAQTAQIALRGVPACHKWVPKPCSKSRLAKSSSGHAVVDRMILS